MALDMLDRYAFRRMLAGRWLAMIRSCSISFFLRPIYIGALGKLKFHFPWSFFLGKSARKIGFGGLAAIGHQTAKPNIGGIERGGGRAWLMRVRKLAVNVFERTAQSLRLSSVNPKGLKTFTLSFTVSVYAAGGLEAGWKEANGDK